MTLTNEELIEKQNQITLRAEIENLKLDLDSKKSSLISDLVDLESHFDSSKQYAETLRSELTSIKFDDYSDIDTSSEIGYLIRDHDQYSSTMSEIEKLKQFRDLLELLEEKSKGLDY